MRIEGEARLKVYAGSRGGRAEATGGHVFELQRLQRALKQAALCSLVISPSHVFELQRALKQVVAVRVYLLHSPASFLPYLLT